MEQTASRLVILGAGQAGAQLAFSARSEGFEGEITLVGEEPMLPYRRPPLSKEYLAGAAPKDQILVRRPEFFAEQRIDVRVGVCALEIDREAQTVRLSDGTALHYSALGLTLGTRVRRLTVPGSDLPGVHYIRSVADVDCLLDALKAARSAVIIGGGFVGLEAAAVLRSLGLSVTVLEIEKRLLPRVVSPVLSDFYARYHESRGVSVCTGAQVTGIERGADQALRVVCADGRVFAADLAVVGIGVVPNQELAEAAGLTCADGIVVDEFARTSDPSIVAAGDCAYHPSSLLGKSLRLESVHNAIAQATTAAQTVCGRLTPYAQFPWFWSDQYDLKLQMVGLSEGADEAVVRGDMEARKFSVFYFRDARLIAVDSVNAPPEHILCKRLLAAFKSPTPAQAADRAFDLKTLLSTG